MKPFLLLLFPTVIVAQQRSFNISDWRILLTDSVTDVDDNHYGQQQLGNQIWLTSNLRATRFNNSDSIEQRNESLPWISATLPAYCKVVDRKFYQSDDSLLYRDTQTQELFYNAYVVTDVRNICPTGWHVPTIKDWQLLESWVSACNEDFASQFYDSTSNWFGLFTPWGLDIDFDGLSFSNQAFGYRSRLTADYSDYEDFGYWWSKEAVLSAQAWARILYDRGFGVDDLHVEYNQQPIPPNTGMSIRCVKNNTLEP